MQIKMKFIFGDDRAMLSSVAKHVILNPCKTGPETEMCIFDTCKSLTSCGIRTVIFGPNMLFPGNIVCVLYTMHRSIYSDL